MLTADTKSMVCFMLDELLSSWYHFILKIVLQLTSTYGETHNTVEYEDDI